MTITFTEDMGLFTVSYLHLYILEEMKVNTL